MKKVIILCLVCFSVKSFSQVQEIEQLRLDLEKLVQMKSMLSSMNNGYATLSSGYNQITGLARGNFDLHKNWLDGLLQVALPVKNYPLIQTVMDKQSLIISESQAAYLFYLKSGLFKADELFAIKSRFDLIRATVSKCLSHLRVVLTAGALRMSDQERISAIDRIDQDVGAALVEMRAQVKEQNALAALRGQKKNEIEAMRLLYGLKN